MPTSEAAAASAFRCPNPECLSALFRGRDEAICAGPQQHRFVVVNGYPRFAPDIDIGKYGSEYAQKYAFLWSFGYETLGIGLTEGLYRTTMSLAAEALSACEQDEPLVIDCGCGVGRVTADLARLNRRARVIGIDASPSKLDLAKEILLQSGAVERALPALGFPQRLRIAGRGLQNVSLAQADAFSMPIASGSADLVVSQNLIDRLGHDPERGFTLTDFLAEVRRVLRPGGHFVLLSPLNWELPAEWALYPTGASIRSALQNNGFAVDVFFDQLLYRELLDARGSVEEFTTTVLAATAA